MSETGAFKENFNPAMVRGMARSVAEIYPEFDADGFIAQVLSALP